MKWWGTSARAAAAAPVSRSGPAGPSPTTTTVGGTAGLGRVDPAGGGGDRGRADDVARDGGRVGGPGRRDDTGRRPLLVEGAVLGVDLDLGLGDRVLQPGQELLLPALGQLLPGLVLDLVVGRHVTRRDLDDMPPELGLNGGAGGADGLVEHGEEELGDEPGGLADVTPEGATLLRALRVDALGLGDGGEVLAPVEPGLDVVGRGLVAHEDVA